MTHACWAELIWNTLIEATVDSQSRNDMYFYFQRFYFNHGRFGSLISPLQNKVATHWETAM